jgi:hypothetical protein
MAAWPAPPPDAVGAVCMAADNNGAGAVAMELQEPDESEWLSRNSAPYIAQCFVFNQGPPGALFRHAITSNYLQISVEQKQ